MDPRRGRVARLNADGRSVHGPAPSNARPTRRCGSQRDESQAVAGTDAHRLRGCRIEHPEVGPTDETPTARRHEWIDRRLAIGHRDGSRGNSLARTLKTRRHDAWIEATAVREPRQESEEVARVLAPRVKGDELLD